MSIRYDAIVIGAGLGGLTAAAMLAKAGRSTLLIERNYGVGGAASTYKAGDLVVEGSLHETANPEDPIDPKHAILKGLGVLDKVFWVPTGCVYEARGGPLGPAFVWAIWNSRAFWMFSVGFLRKAAFESSVEKQ